MTLLPLPANWVAGQEFTADAENDVERAVNALGDGSLPIPKSVLVSSASTLTLTSSNNVFVFTGSAPGTWTLPPIAGNLGLYFQIYNRGPAPVTIQRAGSDNLMYQGSSATSISVGVGGSVSIVNDGTYWTFLSAYLPAPVFDAIGPGYSGNATTVSWSHTAALGADIFVDIATSATSVAPTSVTIGGTAATLVTSEPLNNVAANGSGYRYRLARAGTGSGQTVLITMPSAQNFAANSISYAHVNAVNAVGSPSTIYGNTNPTSQSVTAPARALILQGFQTQSAFFYGITATTGGTNRYVTSSSGNLAALTISDTTVSDTFTASANQNINWSAIATVLS